ncbi:MAG: NTP transferase domain-containing protein [bacterium]|nr:NTP transferase domain-containing protein [bacterium]
MKQVKERSLEMDLTAIILAAGKGTRMKSSILKVAHHVAGEAIVNYVVEAVLCLGVDKVLLVVGHQSEVVKEITDKEHICYVTQEEQLGTGHAVMQTESYFDINSKGNVMILPGDCPLVEESTLRNLLAIHNESNASGSILTTRMNNPGNYGRIIRGEMGTVVGIIEAKDCSPEQKTISEINTGIYVFKIKQLFNALKKINTDNVQNEYYLTDIISIMKQAGEVISAYCTDDQDQAIGINTRMDQAKINEIIYRRNNDHFMAEGVTIIDPGSTFIDSTVKIGTDTIIHPFTVIHGHSVIGQHCTIGSHTYIADSVIKDREKIEPFTKKTG